MTQSDMVNRLMDDDWLSLEERSQTLARWMMLATRMQMVAVYENTFALPVTRLGERYLVAALRQAADEMEEKIDAKP